VAICSRLNSSQPCGQSDGGRLCADENLQPLRAGLAPRFFGAGGPRLAAAGAELAFDLTQHSSLGFQTFLTKYFEFRRLFQQLLKLAV